RSVAMIQMQFPEFLLLIVPLTFLCWRWGTFAPDWKWLVPALAWGASHWWWMPPFWSHLWLIFPLAMFLKPWLAEAGMTGALRMAVALLLLFALTGPEWNLGGTGIDVVIVVDRSRSMPAEANLKELIANIGTNRKSGDRVSVVTFGTESRVEHELSDKVSLGEFGQVIAPDGSDLNDALLTALDRVDRNRPARILVLSDGESNGAPPTFAARRAREMGVPIDYRLFERPRVGDVAVRDLILPEEVEPREPLQLSVEVYSNKQTTGTLTLLRDGQQVASREVDLLPGTATFPFRDIIDRVGLAEYRAELTVEEDPLPENNSSAGVVRVSGESRLLVLNSDGQSGNLVRELLAAKLPVDVVRASEHPLTRESLDSYAAVIVENVPAQELGLTKMEVLAQFVEDMGGGFLLTGGKRSFGVGGYFRSPLDEVLPVSMEMREEHRKTNIAIAVALDRSGSMSMTVPGGMQKMDLANLGTAEVVKMLTPGDSIAVIAVDSDAHIIQPLTDVTNPEAIAKKIRGIRSEGGGIYVYNALVAAGTELAKAVQATKHIILFSDAQDSEEPGAYATLIAKYRKAGITVSVIGLGTLHDPDAKLLQDIAKLGDGNCMFTEDAKSLPKLFSADTMSVVRSNFVEKDEKTQPDGIGGAMLLNARLMGNLLS
ncbi:MAG: VWA domain-containing protein, partial [Planctomycetaceae bacterium]